MTVLLFKRFLASWIFSKFTCKLKYLSLEISIFTSDNTPWNGDVVCRCYKDGECTLNEKRTACNNCKDGWYGDIRKFNKFNKCNGHGEVTVNDDKTLFSFQWFIYKY